MDRALLPAYHIDAAPAPTLTRLARPNNSKVISPLFGRDVRLAYWYLKRYATAFSPYVAISFQLWRPWRLRFAGLVNAKQRFPVACSGAQRRVERLESSPL